MPGAYEPEYVRAREVLLDALTALQADLDALTLVGAQAVYLHTGEGDLAVAPNTTDADVAVEPRELVASPTIDELMDAAHFEPGAQPGSWRGRYNVVVDLMVPAALGGAGSRAARIPPHSRRAARKAIGLECAIVDRVKMTVSALDASDLRSFDIWVGTPAALLVAKLHKIADRVDAPDRLDDKDALDTLRLLQATDAQGLGSSLTRLSFDDFAGPTASNAIVLLRDLFGAADAPGARMAGRAVEGLADPAEISASCAALAHDVLASITG